MRMRRSMVVLLALMLPVLGGCRKSSRPDARAAFVTQLQQEGGLTPDVAECIVDRFFADRTDQDLKEFFERDELTIAEAEEFGRLAEACAPTTTDSGLSG
ncbi:MAG: hypothetical protein RI900_998 [Actinomycetota bacterium]|jgi:hypothetical protein